MNSGATPPVNLRLRSQCGVFPAETDDPTVWMRFMSHQVEMQDIGPNEISSGVMCALPAASVQSAIQGKAFFYYVLRAQYLDVFGASHEFQSCEKIISYSGDASSFNHEIGISSTPCRTHNCTDDECKAEGSFD
jgi:hypothetical protein